MDNTSELSEIVDREIDAAREELVDLCGRLVAAASINPPGRTDRGGARCAQLPGASAGRDRGGGRR